MTEEEMFELWKDLSLYKENAYGYYRDPDMGTYVKYGIGDYVIDCHFFLEGWDPTDWELFISVGIKSSYGDKIMDPRHFPKADIEVIHDTIDTLEKAINTMPPVISTLRARFKTALEETA